MKNIYFLKNVINIYILLLSFVLSINPMFGQTISSTDISIQGQLIDKKSKAFLPYAHIYNLRTKVGFVTDESGYFGFDKNRIGDTLSVSFIGYLSKTIVLKSDHDLIIELEESSQALGELTLEYDNSDYLYQLVQACKRNKSKVFAEGKAYYELQSYRDGKQVELVESFYNAEVKGYDLEHLKMKVGRLGVQTSSEGRSLVSFESSKAILELNLMEDAAYFYKNPFQLSYRQLKKQYDLYLYKSYKQDGQDIVVIRFSPTSEELDLFKGLVWIDKTNKRIYKIVLECKDCRLHPFRMNSDEGSGIDQVDLNIVKTFESKGGNVILNHVDFTYELNYSSRERELETTTKVLMHMYNFNQQFNLPKFNTFDEPRHDQDYRDIAEAPYNTFFWNNHNEFSVFDKGNENKEFFNHPNTIQGEEFLHKFRISGGKEMEFFEHPSFTWSKKRLRFAEPRKEDTTAIGYKKQETKYYGAYNGQFKSDMYRFYGKIYLDRNEYNGKVDIVLESIFDSSRSFYKLPVDWKVQVFVNMYFDLVEIEKLKLEKLIESSDKSIETIDSLYSESEQRLFVTHKMYLKEVRRGEDRPAMEKWSAFILGKLHVNNLEAFQHE